MSQTSNFEQLFEKLMAKEIITYGQVKEALSPKARSLSEFTEESLRKFDGLESVDILTRQDVTGTIYYILSPPNTIILRNLSKYPKGDDVSNHFAPHLSVDLGRILTAYFDIEGRQVPTQEKISQLYANYRGHAYNRLRIPVLKYLYEKTGLDYEFGYASQLYRNEEQDKKLITKTIDVIKEYNSLMSNPEMIKQAREILELEKERDDLMADYNSKTGRLIKNLKEMINFTQK
ncbi:MAG: hypothetical protein KAI26_04505 [Nanoarchaeota archaeon]|nr:hypothetical protein [Nanoarchaeota archaeon]